MSQGENNTFVIGRAFINCSISHNKVMKVSSVRALDPMMAYRVFDATNETFPGATKMWCLGGVERSRYLVVSKNFVHRGAVEGGHQFFFFKGRFGPSIFWLKNQIWSIEPTSPGLNSTSSIISGVEVAWAVFPLSRLGELQYLCHTICSKDLLSFFSDPRIHCKTVLLSVQR